MKIIGDPESIANRIRIRFNNRPFFYRLRVRLWVKRRILKDDIRWYWNKLVKYFRDFVNYN